MQILRVNAQPWPDRSYAMTFSPRVRHPRRFLSWAANKLRIRSRGRIPLRKCQAIFVSLHDRRNESVYPESPYIEYRENYVDTRIEVHATCRDLPRYAAFKEEVNEIKLVPIIPERCGNEGGQGWMCQGLRRNSRNFERNAGAGSSDDVDGSD